MNKAREFAQQMSCLGAALPLFLIRNGQEWEGNVWRGRKGTARMCYQNAFRLIMEDESLIYCEGMAAHGDLALGVDHAWCVNPAGEVLDPTWKTGTYTIHGHRMTFGRQSYFGVPLPREKVLREVLRTGCYGVLHADEMYNLPFLKALDPGLMEAVTQAKAQWDRTTREVTG